MAGRRWMLRIYLLQQWFNLSDPAVEEALYQAAMRAFAGIDLCREPAPDETTVCKFRHLLERHELGARLFAAISAHLQANGIAIGIGTIVDATIITALSSTKNATRTRDPEMRQTKKGNQWYFGIKAHVVNAASKFRICAGEKFPRLRSGDHLRRRSARIKTSSRAERPLLRSVVRASSESSSKSEGGTSIHSPSRRTARQGQKVVAATLTPSLCST